MVYTSVHSQQLNKISRKGHNYKAEPASDAQKEVESRNNNDKTNATYVTTDTSQQRNRPGTVSLKADILMWIKVGVNLALWLPAIRLPLFLSVLFTCVMYSNFRTITEVNFFKCCPLCFLHSFGL